ncbi:MAG: class I SAM-dependent rRNA methyltransferase [Lachnospiraceae bacterium]|nr:class I SAM-dependent rRNA methyltransferase [Lachnospiraceae bacterium]
MSDKATIKLKKGQGRYLKAGGAWIFDNEIDLCTGSYENGALVDVVDFDDYPLGVGYINDNSKIRIRMLSRKAGTVIDDAFFYQRLKAAWEYRKCVLAPKDLTSCRVVFGEADFLPGVTIDKYEDLLVVQSLALGIDRYKERIVDLLIQVLLEDGIKIRGAYERSDARERKKEGLPLHKGILRGTFAPEIEIVENDVHYLVNVAEGQKTGFFLDQKYNRLAMQRICKGKKVLDCFTHMGTFALNAGFGGAKSVLGLDISDYAIEQARENAKRNHLEETVRFQTANVLDALPGMVAAGDRFDVVILDPPAFTKSREATKQAIKGYREINMQGLRLVEDGGYLATCSCSHFMTQELFVKTIKEAAGSVHKRLRQVEARTQAPDHPILWAADESFYLKFYIFQVVSER